MKSLLTTIVLTVLAAAPVFAQVGEVKEREIGGNTGNARDYLIQNLTPKELAKLQSQQTSGNVTSLTQHGNGNVAIIQQVGTQNVTDLTQNGNGNFYEGQIIGNDNLNLIKQNGSQNVIQQEIRADGHVYKITQQGNGNALRQSEIGTIQSVPVEITQKGQGMQVSITNGKID